MTDVHSPATRSYNMSRIKSKDTKPEMVVRRFLHAHGFRYRLHDKKLPGKPDMVVPIGKMIIFEAQSLHSRKNQHFQHRIVCQFHRQVFIQEMWKPD
jgi:DNA mismatch endonuclease Vsr